jgi:hypothetical protein
LQKDVRNNQRKSRINLFHRGEYIGTVQLLSASHGTGRLGFDVLPDVDVKREELCELGNSGKKGAA